MYNQNGVGMSSTQPVYASPGMAQPMQSPGMVQPMQSPGLVQPMQSPGMTQPMQTPGMTQPLQYGQMPTASQPISSQYYTSSQSSRSVESIFQTSTSYTYGI